MKYDRNALKAPLNVQTQSEQMASKDLSKNKTYRFNALI